MPVLKFVIQRFSIKLIWIRLLEFTIIIWTAKVSIRTEGCKLALLSQDKDKPRADVNTVAKFHKIWGKFLNSSVVSELPSPQAVKTCVTETCECLSNILPVQTRI